MTKKTSHWTLFLLCAGYFIDFYDLSIMGASYHGIISEQFSLTDNAQIQQVYLCISNFQTIGIFIGALVFGMLGDKIGRVKAIQYSILLYAITTVLAVYTHSLPVFIALRLLAYVGLSTEFATSTVLILESFSFKSAAWGTALLYSFGVCGGILATSISLFSWKIMFLFGGFSGFFLYLGRRKIQESEAYLYAKQSGQVMGSFREMLGQKEHVFRLIRYFCMILPYFALISFMFVFPNAIIHEYTLAYATQLLLLGFFCGNIISSLLSGLFVQYCQNVRLFIAITFVLFLFLMLTFPYISESYWWLYSTALGLLGGGYPILVAQNLGRESPVAIRSLSSNTLFALGRASGIGFNGLISYWLNFPEHLNSHIQWASVLIFIVASLSLYQYHSKKFDR